jgi:predicted Ser/Thr protein kinase
METELSLLSLPVLSNVTIISELGKGNFGQVYKGNWKGSIVALKVLKSTSNGEYKAFVKECEMLR